ncbi:hypothetical protein CHLNCDRAFT_55285 [Chlorella variabilis]|uniref:PPM-type phosphatase domain-containing protein n=1 Tax=Chlorella variabilis TaxID=554065 RepID=E1ZSK6_CHLVA|nr:hypothetical protein CHLNCDRAFT_55285 [Chlorella variabilis]EFN51169.1 hypothetical protein CHLNCDRAFT_55285 [Chlorella variabilis]|eukprot:XP_005843271.1 hypothetical protein CHLNCDRAFT_55285 [Chlorella variabilis]
MGLCASTHQPPSGRSDGSQQKGKPGARGGEVQGAGKVFHLDVDAGSKAAGLRRQQPGSPPISARLSQQQQQQQQQQGELGEQPSGSAQRRPSSGGSSSSGGGVGGASTRARRLSFTGPCGGTAAAPALPAAPSSSSLSSAGTPREETSGRGGLPALSAQPALPEAHPLPERRVRFDSPIKTHGRREEEEAGAGTAPLASPLVPVAPRVGAPPLPPPSALRQASREGTPSRPSAAPAPPLSPAKAAAAAFAAAEARLRRGLAAGGSPTKAAAAAAVPMSELIHSVASLSRAGREPSYRKQNQDTCFAFSQYCRPTQALLAALDGHGPHGHAVSEFLRQKLPLELAEQLGESGTVAGRAAAAAGAGGAAAGTPADAAAALSATFLRVDRELCGGSGVSVAYSGSTAVVCMLQGRRLTTAWVGDSRAVLARQEPRGCRAICLTRDHKPSTPDERARILMSGGRVEHLSDQRGQPVGPQRVWLADSWVPGLAMSRALGDAVAHTVGVSSEPETSVVELCPQDKWLLLATDGVWEFMEPQLAVDIVSGCKDAEEACRMVNGKPLVLKASMPQRPPAPVRV